MNQHITAMARALLSAGVRQGGVLLVHASLRALGPFAGGAEAVVQGLLHALGEEGTLLMPALSYQHVTKAQPHHDVRLTPCNVGALPEYFRTRPGTFRSMHPTHSVSGVGRLVEPLLAGHEADDTPCGANSPFSRLRDVDGQILMLGCGLCPNTSMHAIEEHVAPPYLFGDAVNYQLRFADGREVTQRYRTHGFSHYRQRYDRVSELLPPTALREGRCLQATVHLLDVRALWETSLAALRGDPYFFVERYGEEWVEI